VLDHIHRWQLDVLRQVRYQLLRSQITPPYTLNCGDAHIHLSSYPFVAPVLDFLSNYIPNLALVQLYYHVTISHPEGLGI